MISFQKRFPIIYDRTRPVVRIAGGGGNWGQIIPKSFSIFCAGLPQAEESKPMQKGETNATKPLYVKNKVMNVSVNSNNVMNDIDNHYFE